MARRGFAAVAATIVLSTLGLPLAAAPAHAAPTLPPGFVQTSRPSGQPQYQLTAFDLLPDGGMLTAGKAGTVAWVPADGSAPKPVSFKDNSVPEKTSTRLNVRNTGDIGLVGLTVAPDYATTGAVFTVYAYTAGSGEGFHRLSEWRVDDVAAPQALRSERVILDGISVGPYNVHGATEVVAGPDGTLWLSIGDGGAFANVDPIALRSLDVDDPHGKVLRVARDGKGVASNPYYDAAAPSSWRSRVYASGLRSPFRFTLDPRTGGPVVADVGWKGFEEIDVLRPGASYGWPCWEGPEPTPGYKDLAGCAGVQHTPPSFSYPRADGVSVTGGVFYSGEAWPEQYRGAYFFGDYASQRLWSARIGTDGAFIGKPVPFGAGIGGPVHFRSAANGDVLYADIYGATIVRLSYAAGNRAPNAEVSTTTDPVARTVRFDAAASNDLDGDQLTWSWDFGDPGVTTDVAQGPVVSYTYPACEEFTATLTLRDVLGAETKKAVKVYPSNHQPVLTVIGAAGSGRGGTFVVGDPVTLSGTASDPEDGDVALAWRSALVHCRGTSCHDHDPQASTGPSFSTVFDDHGGDTKLVVRAEATDSRGAVSSYEFTARPSLRRLQVTTTPPARVTLNGDETASMLVTEGSTNSVSVSSTATDGVATFSAWQDGSTARTRQVVVGAGGRSMAATYLTPIDQRYAAEPGLRAVLGRPVGAEQGGPTLRWRDYAGGRLYWTPATGVRAVTGAIKDTYLKQGGHVVLGVPTTDELGTPDGVGRFNHFSTGSSIYWTPRTGAHSVGGAIRQRWAALGWERSPLGYPTTSELLTPDGVGRYNHFSKAGSVYWTPGTGAQAVGGAIRERWAALGWERGPLGYPTTSERGSPDGVGRYNHFSKAGSVYWTPGTGAHGVWGAIRQRWAVLGWERSYLGYPRSSEYAVPGGVRNDFQRGTVTWTARTGQAVDRPS